MTPLRQRAARRGPELLVVARGGVGFRRWLFALALCVGVVALAPLAHADGAPSAKPDASAGKGWLKAPPAPKKVAQGAAGPSALRVVLTAVFVIGLGGAALWMRRKRSSASKVTHSELQVIATARVSGKAQVLVLRVGDRRVLLGVTDAQVSSLGWLEGELESETRDAAAEAPSALFAPEALPSAAIPTSPRTVQSLARAAASPGPRRFRDAFLDALGRERPPEASAAELLAETTRDVVVRSNSRSAAGEASQPVAAPAAAPEMVDVEGQARGLLLRLQKRS